jgi:hypothetical protein
MRIRDRKTRVVDTPQLIKGAELADKARKSNGPGRTDLGEERARLIRRLGRIADHLDAVRELRELGLRGPVRLQARWQRMFVITKEALRAVWPAVEAVAQALLEKRELDRQAVCKIVEPFDLYGPVYAVQRKYRLM